MKKLLIILVVIISSCTGEYNTKTRVKCPCIVNKTQVTSNGYYIEADGTSVGTSIGFFTTYKYNLGDTIK